MSTALRCCVTQKEVERYVELFHGKEQSAIPNQGSDDGACTGGAIRTKGGIGMVA